MSKFQWHFDVEILKPDFIRASQIVGDCAKSVRFLVIPFVFS